MFLILCPQTRLAMLITNSNAILTATIHIKAWAGFNERVVSSLFAVIRVFYPRRTLPSQL